MFTLVEVQYLVPGHFLMLEQPKAWADEILNYVGGVPNNGKMKMNQ